MKPDADNRDLQTPERFRILLKEHGMDLPVEANAESLRLSARTDRKTIPNRICIQPLEGYDSLDDGSPSDLVYRRYRRFAHSGAGIVWFESAAVAEDGKSNPHQMMLSSDHISGFHALLAEMDRICLEEYGYTHYKVLQLTHSGRVSRGSEWNRRPVAARRRASDPDGLIPASDERIFRLIDEMVEHAVMAWKAGFDAVDIKACHGYFLSELLGAYERNGEFGGALENRMRALLCMIDRIRKRTDGELGLAVRLNAYDSAPYPDGRGLKREGDRLSPDLSETVEICRMLRDRGVGIIDISASQPRQPLFLDAADETTKPYVGAFDLICAVREIRKQVPGVLFVCSGLSQFRQFGPAVGAGGIRDGWFDLAGFGRQALAYPGFVQIALAGECLDPDRCCVLCGSCFRLMDPGLSAAGCVVRDPDPYAVLYRENVAGRRN